jgi:glycosyltransferase involved in cell wall biosynthesis
MKIAIVANSINGMTGAGRIIATQTRFLADKLKSLNVAGDVTVISNQIKHVKFAANSLITIRQPLLRFIHDKKRQSRFGNFAKSLIQTEKYDLVISHNQGYGDIAFIHNFYLRQKPETAAPKAVQKKTESKQHSGIIVVPSEKTKELYLLTTDSNRDVRVLIPGIDIERFNKNIKSKKAELRRKYGMQNTSEKPLFVVSLIASGQLQHRGINDFLKVIKNLSNSDEIQDLFVIVVGNVSWYAKPKLIFLLKQLNVRFKYFQRLKEIEEIYAVTDLMIFPSKNDTFGMVVAEAVACGVPVITNQNVGASQILSDAQEFVVPSNDSVSEMSELAIKVFQQQKFYTEIFEKISEKVTLNYSWAEHLKNFHKIIEDVLAKKKCNTNDC